jgi:winged helix DNA-binding protein
VGATTRPRIDIRQRRARLGQRHHLAASARAVTPVEVARGLVALHGTDPATVFLAIAARETRPSVGDIERALYDERTLLRMLGMRRTMFVVPVEVAPVVQAACTNAIAAQERRRSHQLFGAAGIADEIEAWLTRVEADTLVALQRRGEATAQELGAEVPDLRKTFVGAEGKPYAAVQGVATRILMQLSADGHIVRGRPRGSWISSQYRWSPIGTWLPDGLPQCEKGPAQTELIRRWLAAFGPGTLADLKWWTGLTMGEVKRAVAELDVDEVDLDGGSGLILAQDVAEVAEPAPWVTLLPALDPTPMGYVERDWYLGPHAPKIFDRSGNIGPTVWADGRIVGGWAQRSNGAIAYKLLEDVGQEAERQVTSAAHELGQWLGPIRITPRFRTPLERELSA